jgi:hypothetical protein
MDVGLRKTIGPDMGRPGSGSNQIWGILSLQNLFSIKEGTNQAPRLTSWDGSGSYAMPTRWTPLTPQGLEEPDWRIHIPKWRKDPFSLFSLWTCLYTYSSTHIHTELQMFAGRSDFILLYKWCHNYAQPHGVLLIVYSSWLTIKDRLLCSGTLLWSPCKSPRVVLGLHFDICNIIVISLTSHSTTFNLCLTNIKPNVQSLSKLHPSQTSLLLFQVFPQSIPLNSLQLKTTTNLVVTDI